MALSIGIVGLPNAGKSSLFNALSRAGAPVAAYPFTTIDPYRGVVPVPDPRVDAIASVTHPERIVPATVEFVDIAGLVRGASRGEGLGNQFLAQIRDADAIAHVVRCFPDPEVPHVEGAGDPGRDIEIGETGLALADLAVAERAPEGGLVGTVAQEALQSYGMEAYGLLRLFRFAYGMLGLVTFFTMASKEVRAWSVRRGTRAPQAAGTIHTDMEHGFVRAEVIAWESLVRAGSPQAARDLGLVRLEGKDYVVQDGDVLLIRFAL